MSVEPATPSDIPAIMAVERMPGFEGLVGRFSQDEHESEMAKPSVCYLVARDELGVVSGFALLQGVGDPDGRVHLKRIAVRDVGRGAGSALLRAALAWLFTETDANRVDLDVFVENERARRAYEKTGFTVEGRLREYHRSPFLPWTGLDPLSLPTVAKRRGPWVYALVDWLAGRGLAQQHWVPVGPKRALDR